MRNFLAIGFISFHLCALSQPTFFSPRGIGGGGALFFPSINPANDNEFYVSCDMSALFFSSDFGKSYSQIHFSKLQVSGTSTYEFTKNPNIAYVNFNDGNSVYPVKTTDGGNTWKALQGYISGTYGNVYKLSANYSNPDQLLVGGYGDILFSSNGGTTFKLIKHATNMGAGLVFAGVLWDEKNIYIGTNEGLIVSTDGGVNFVLQQTTGIPAGNQIWNFAGAKNGTTTRFVCITANTSKLYNGIMPWDYYNFASGVYTMDNDNGTWISRSAGINFSSDFVMYTGMAQNDINTIYLGGNDSSTGGPLVYKSAEGGAGWKKVFNTTGNMNIITGWEGFGGDKTWGWSETCFGISVAPLNSARVLFGNFSNVQSTTDGGTTWRQAYTNSGQHPAGSGTPKKQYYTSIGLENTTCWQVFWIDKNNMFGCFSDIGGIRSADGGISWSFDFNGFSVNSLYRMIRSASGKLYGACSRVHDIYQSTRLTDGLLDVNDTDGKIVFSADNGANWTTLHQFGHPVIWLATDPGNSERMYASVVHFGGIQGSQAGGIYFTGNLSAGSGSAWTKLSNPPRTEGHPACIEVLNDGRMICTFSGRRGTSGFTASSGVFMYDPASDRWTDLSHPGMYYWTNDIILDPSDPAQNTWFVCVFSGWGGPPNGLGGLYKTTNRGTNWTKLTDSQFDRVSSLTFNPQNKNEAYLTTETQGLWFSRNMNAATPAWQIVDAYPFRQPLRVFFNPRDQNEVWVTSFGNGMKVGLLKSSEIKKELFKGNAFNVYPNPFNKILNIDSPQGTEISRVNIYNLSGQCLMSTRNNSRQIDCTALSHGTYFAEIVIQKNQSFHRKILKLPE